MSEEAYRDELIRRLKRALVEIEEIAEELVSAGFRDATFWTEFDVKRTTLEIRVAARCLEGCIDKMHQAGRWPLILKKGVTWADLKKQLKIR